ncbi:MAG: hypothetical protein ACYTEQ_10635 [Planctomycetota bacterium]|jgi:hypothetical protein
MAGQEDDNKLERIRPGRKWLLRALVFLAAALVVLVFLWISGRWGIRSAEEKLAAINAARAIPDDENAAVIYTQLAETTDLASDQPEFLSGGGFSGPWLSADHPEAAEWLRARQSAIARLMEACQRQRCYFPLPAWTGEWERYVAKLTAMRHWAFLLVSAADNDVAEGRIDAGLEKCLCVVRMANHSYQQPTKIDFLVGAAIEALALQTLNRFIVEGAATEGHLRTIEESLPATENNWERDWPKIVEVEKLLEYFPKKEVGYFRWLILRFKHGTFHGDDENRFKEIHLRVFAERRGTRILVALRRYKNKRAFWPGSLDEIKSLLPPQVTIDPTNNGPFIYTLTGNEFELYSRGENKIDEDGRFRDTADDWPIWPREADLRQRRR